MFKSLSNIISCVVAFYLVTYIINDLFNNSVTNKTILCAVFLCGMSILTKLDQNKNSKTTIEIKD